MKRVYYSTSFLADQDEISLYIAERSLAAADKFLERINLRTLPLASFSLMGRARPDIHPECRQLVVENYLILYRETPEQVELVRLLHGARDLGAVDFPVED